MVFCTKTKAFLLSADYRHAENGLKWVRFGSGKDCANLCIDVGIENIVQIEHVIFNLHKSKIYP